MTSKIVYLKEEKTQERFSELLKDHKEKKGKIISPWQEIFFRYKPIFWEYENEYRLVIPFAPNMYIDPNAEINEVVFGFRSKPEDEVAVWSALRDTIKYKKANNRNGKIEIEEYHPPTQIQTTNKYLITMDDIGADAENIPEEKDFKPAKFEFK